MYEALSKEVAEQAEGLPSAAGAASAADDTDRQAALPQAGLPTAFFSFLFFSLPQAGPPPQLLLPLE